MSCGCKGNQNPKPQTTTTQQGGRVATNRITNPTIQESIKKVVEKYYKK